MKTALPATFTEYWRGKAEIIDPPPTKIEPKEVQPEDLGKEWRELIESVQTAAKKEWELNKG